jgi:hypothetical protein
VVLDLPGEVVAEPIGQLDLIEHLRQLVQYIRSIISSSPKLAVKCGRGR